MIDYFNQDNSLNNDKKSQKIPDIFYVIGN